VKSPELAEKVPAMGAPVNAISEILQKM